jgi:hypothetical protein
MACRRLPEVIAEHPTPSKCCTRCGRSRSRWPEAESSTRSKIDARGPRSSCARSTTCRPDARRPTPNLLCMPQPLGVFCPSPWYIFVRISFCCVFNRSTQEPYHGEESKEGDEKEGQEEEVISNLDVRRRRTFECDASVRRLDTSSRLFLARHVFRPVKLRFFISATHPQVSHCGSRSDRR